MGVLAGAVLALAAAAQEKPVPKPVLKPALQSAKAGLLVWGDEARTHVSAERIVRGTVHVHQGQLKKAIADAGYVSVRVDVRENIFGPEQEPAHFRVYVPVTGVPTKSWEVASKDVTSWDGQDRIVFLSRTDGRYYLANDKRGQSVVEPTRYAIKRVRHRETLHRKLLAQPLRQDRKRQKAVTRLMKRMCGGKEMQHETFSDLEDLGRDAVVEMVAAMDVRRKLPDSGITLRNKAKDRFEATRHYSPKLVVDAMAAILNQNVGESFGFIYSGAPDAERAACVRSWTLFAHYELAARRTEPASNRRFH